MGYFMIISSYLVKAQDYVWKLWATVQHWNWVKYVSKLEHYRVKQRKMSLYTTEQK